jgi:hypothetical protein
LLTSFGEAKEVSRLPGRTPGLVIWQDIGFGASACERHREAAVAFEVGF